MSKTHFVTVQLPDCVALTLALRILPRNLLVNRSYAGYEAFMCPSRPFVEGCESSFLATDVYYFEHALGEHADTA